MTGLRENKISEENVWVCVRVAKDFDLLNDLTHGGIRILHRPLGIRRTVESAAWLEAVDNEE